MYLLRSRRKPRRRRFVRRPDGRPAAPLASWAILAAPAELRWTAAVASVVAAVDGEDASTATSSFKVSASDEIPENRCKGASIYDVNCWHGPAFFGLTKLQFITRALQIMRCGYNEISN